MKATTFRRALVGEDIPIATPADLVREIFKLDPKARHIQVAFVNDAWTVTARGKVLGYTNGDAPEVCWKRKPEDASQILGKAGRRKAIQQIQGKLSCDYKTALTVYQQFIQTMNQVKPEADVLAYKGRFSA